MHIKVNKRRVQFHPTCSEHEIFEKVKSKLSWPKNRAFFEWSDTFVVEILNENELRFACRLISENTFCEIKNWQNEFQHYETKVAQRFAEPDSASSEGEMCSEDDISTEDFYMMGYRHEICN